MYKRKCYVGLPAVQITRRILKIAISCRCHYIYKCKIYFSCLKSWTAVTIAKLTIMFVWEKVHENWEQQGESSSNMENQRRKYVNKVFSTELVLLSIVYHEMLNLNGQTDWKPDFCIISGTTSKRDTNITSQKLGKHEVFLRRPVLGCG